MTASDPPADTPGTPPADGRSGWSVAVLVATFLAGLLLGGLVVAVTGDGDGNGTPEAGATPTPTPSASPTTDDVTIVVPRSCLDVAAKAEQSLSLLQDAAGALTNLQGGELGAILDEAQRLEPELRGAISGCRQATASASVSPGPGSGS